MTSLGGSWKSAGEEATLTSLAHLLPFPFFFWVERMSGSSLIISQTILPLPNDIPSSSVKHVRVKETPFIVSPLRLLSSTSPPFPSELTLSLLPSLYRSDLPIRRCPCYPQLDHGPRLHSPVLVRLPWRRKGSKGGSHRSVGSRREQGPGESNRPLARRCAL